MKQNKNDGYCQSLVANTNQQQLTQQDNYPAEEIQEEEITQITSYRNKSDYWYLPHADGRTFNQNIKVRNQ